MADSEHNKQEKLTKTRIIVGTAVFVVVAVIAIAYYVHYHSTHISTDDAFVEGNIHTIASKVSGTVKALHIKDNQYVEKDQLLLEIDPVDYDVRVREAASAYEAEKARVLETLSRIETAKRQMQQIVASIAAARAGRDLAEAGLRQARMDMKRADTLLRKEAVSQERYDKTKTALDVSDAQLRAAMERIRELEAAQEVQRSVIRQAEAGLDTQKAMAETRKATMDSVLLAKGYTKIPAPVSGYVTKRNVEVGNQIAQGQPLLAVVPLEGVWIIANYKETEVEKIRPGQKVTIKADTYPEKTFTGVVDSVMAGTGASFSLFPPENATGNYVKVVQRIPVKIIPDKSKDNEQVLRVGMSVVPTISVP